jgi:septum formation protein
MHIILASQSPRRKEILEFFKIPFSVHSSDFDESSVKFNNSAQEFVKELAKQKALVLQKKFPDALIIAADTTVYLDSHIYEKPQNHKQAFEFIKKLQGQTHQVFTGICVTHHGVVLTDIGCTQVTLHNVSEKQIHKYIHEIYPLDKAGGYAIQGPGSILVKKIDGCYYNVMGLPITLLNQLLNNFGIDLWEFGKN